MSSRRRLPDAKTSLRPCHELFAATVAGCTDTRVRPITGPSSPLPETRAICSPVPYLWPWSCPCRPFANLRNHRQRRFKCPMRWHRRDEGIITLYHYCVHISHQARERALVNIRCSNYYITYCNS